MIRRANYQQNLHKTFPNPARLCEVQTSRLSLFKMTTPNFRANVWLKKLDLYYSSNSHVDNAYQYCESRLSNVIGTLTSDLEIAKLE
jgi:hypothetical protein